MKHYLDTIAAIATPTGMGGVGIIRVSGKNARQIAKAITGKELTPRYAHYAQFIDAEGDSIIDKGIVIYFNAPHSYTGEDIVEFQGHGGVYVLQSVLQLILAQGARQARPGEFTERAFLNDKIDLVQAEAVASLIESKSQSAITAALRSLSGEFSDLINKLQKNIIYLRTYIEATLDFSEEEIDFLNEKKISSEIMGLQKKIINTLQKASYGKLLHEGVQLVLVGEANAGKSLLMNRLLGHDRAIVTNEAGTTRDTLEETLLIKNIPVKITDTAGIRVTKNAVEKAGIERAKAAIKSADLAIWLRDGNALSDRCPNELEYVDFIEVHNKADLFVSNKKSCENIVTISAKTGQGITTLIDKIAEKITNKHSEEGVFAARKRHIYALQESKKHIDMAHNLIKSFVTMDLIAEELRLAQNSLSKITGKYSSDDLLGEIFSNFCIGK